MEPIDGLISKKVRYIGNLEKLTNNIFEKNEIINYVNSINIFKVDIIENWDVDNIEITFILSEGCIHSLYVSLNEIELVS